MKHTYLYISIKGEAHHKVKIVFYCSLQKIAQEVSVVIHQVS